MLSKRKNAQAYTVYFVPYGFKCVHKMLWNVHKLLIYRSRLRDSSECKHHLCIRFSYS